MKTFLMNTLAVKVGDLDDNLRRKNLLAIILLGMSLLGIFLLLMFAAFFLLSGQPVNNEIIISLISILLFVFLSVGIYLLNRYRSGLLSSWLFLFLLLIAISFSDSPAQLVDGRSLYLFTLPILIASFILFPSASFAFAALSSLALLLLTYFYNLGVANFFGMIGFFAIAFVAWLASRSMETALRDIRILNRELDKRVEERTRELAEALTREFAETGKNQAILEGIADGVIVFDADGRMIVANPAVCRLLNLARTELLGLSIEQFVAKGGLPDADSQNLLAILRKPDKDAPSTRLLWGNRTLSVTTAGVATLVGKPIGTVAVFRDFTREAELEQMKNTFVAMVSHELRTPLNAILAYAEMIQGEVYGPVNPKQANAAGRIFSNTQRLISLVSDLLDQARLEAGKLKINWEEFAIADLLDAVRGVMEKPARDRGLELQIHLDPETPARVWGDSQRYQQVLINLINNAVKFTEQGRISVHISRPDESHWAIQVSDTGPGIPADSLPYIFDTFRQVDGVTTRHHGGAGLGLSIVKRLVELMGGKIEVSSVLKQGTTFLITAPIYPEKLIIKE
jgi:PAS domain S-box-containing protein